MRIINEAGLYKLIMRSNKPIAQKFQEHVCEVILPSIRKQGEYKLQSIIDKNKELEENKILLEEEKLSRDRKNKKVGVYDATTNELLQVFDSISLASDQLKIPFSSLSSHISFSKNIDNKLYKLII